ncbi:hypothetical protein C8Q74DRAFT_1441906 [Fomes fomentarius]|nr:hypothetical protein C8Q74DRAFT_1441906 [Fomes fomentarius]
MSPPAEILWLVLDAAVEHLDAQISATDMPYEYEVSCLRRERLCLLCACALTCKAMLARARFHLYRSIALYDHWRVPSFAHTMVECDDLSLMVKHLTFGLAEFGFAEDNDHFEMPFPPHAVAQLSNLQSLELDGAEDSSPMPPAALDFAKLFAAACTSLEELSLTRLDFDFFVDFVGVVWSFPHIQKVTISYLHWPPRTIDDSEDDEEWVDVTTLPATPRCCNNLTTVVAGAHVSGMDMSADVWGANVKTLLLQPGPYVNDRDFSSFLSLERLDLPGGFAYAVCVLGNIRSEHLCILEVTQIARKQAYEWMLDQMAEEGREMDAILSQPMFSSLRRVSLTIVYRYYYPQRNEAQWVEHVTARFPGLRDRGILHVSARCGRY